MTDNIKDLEAQEVLARLDERIGVDEEIINGEKRRTFHHSTKYLFDIEQFVNAIAQEYKETGRAKGVREWVDRHGHLQTRPTRLGKKYYGKMNEWIERYSEKHRYAPRVEAFHDACKKIGILGGKKRFWFGVLGDTDVDHHVSFAYWFNRLIERIHEHCSTREFKERERLRKLHERHMEDSVVEFEKALFSEKGRSRWLVLSLTLKYQSQYRRWITLEDVQRHRERFFAARRYNKLMGDIKAYAWALEEGETTGFHLHVILFYACVTRDDERMAKLIGDYWVDAATQGMGAYWNSNEERRKVWYEKKGHGVGVGQIDRTNDRMRESLRVNLKYLVKAEQYFQIKAEGKVRTFDMSDVPKKLKSGCPRVDAVIGEEGINDDAEQSGCAATNVAGDIPWEYAVMSKTGNPDALDGHGTA